MEQIYEKFYTNSEIVECVKQWENGESDTMVVNDKPIHGVLNNGKPVFQIMPYKKFEDGGTMLFETENHRVIIPGGFRRGPTYNTMNPVKYSIGGLSALMSLCHVLIIPKRRIYNAITLKREHIRMISEMEELGATALTKLIEGSTDMVGSIRWQFIQRGTIKLDDDKEYSVELEKEDFMDSCGESFKRLSEGEMESILEESKSQMKFSFHLGKKASVGYLHMHAYLGNFLTKAYEEMEKNERKNHSINEVVYMITSGKTDKYHV